MAGNNIPYLLKSKMRFFPSVSMREQDPCLRLVYEGEEGTDGCCSFDSDPVPSPILLSGVAQLQLWLDSSAGIEYRETPSPTQQIRNAACCMTQQGLCLHVLWSVTWQGLQAVSNRGQEEEEEEAEILGSGGSKVRDCGELGGAGSKGGRKASGGRSGGTEGKGAA